VVQLNGVQVNVFSKLLVRNGKSSTESSRKFDAKVSAIVLDSQISESTAFILRRQNLKGGGT
jgi:hypothetical protein